MKIIRIFEAMHRRGMQPWLSLPKNRQWYAMVWFNDRDHPCIEVWDADPVQALVTACRKALEVTK